MAQSIAVENETEALVALQALATYRALQKAVKEAPHGKGLAFTEAVLRDKGFDQLRKMYESALQEHPEAQKKGPALWPVAVRSARRSGVPRPSRS